VIVGGSLASPGDAAAAGKKRKAAPEGGAVALAPGDQGREASLAVDLSSRGNDGKRTRGAGEEEEEEEEGGAEDGEGEFFDDLDEEDGEGGQSIADRLALLSSAMEESDEDDDDEEEEEGGRAGRDGDGSRFKPKSATSETLTALLTQALSSNDPTQLNVALQVTDRRLVEGTVRSLQSLDAERGDGGVDAATTTGYIPTLMAHLVRRMARRHSLVMPLGVWVKAILAATARSSVRQVAMTRDGGNDAVEARMAREGREMAMKLGPLKNFLNERVECFPQLLRLDGRLALLNQQL
jgi:hypothetical protein